MTEGGGRLDLSQLPPLLQGVIQSLIGKAEDFESTPYGELQVIWHDDRVTWVNVTRKHKEK